MTNKDTLKQYVDTGQRLPDYQINRLNAGLLKTYLRKRIINAENGGDKINIFEFDKMDETMQNQAIFCSHKVYVRLSLEAKKKFVTSFYTKKKKNIVPVYKDIKKGIYVVEPKTWAVFSTFGRSSFDELDWIANIVEDYSTPYIVFNIKEDAPSEAYFCMLMKDGTPNYIEGRTTGQLELIKDLIPKLKQINFYKGLKKKFVVNKQKAKYDYEEIKIKNDYDLDEDNTKYGNIIPICDARLAGKLHSMPNVEGTLSYNSNHNDKHWTNLFVKKYAKVLLSSLEKANYKNHLDIIFNFFQNVKIVKLYIKYNEYDNEEYFKYDTIDLNIFDYLLNSESSSELGKEKLFKLKKMFTDVLYSKIVLNKNARKAIFSFMDSMGVDMLKLTQQIKAKKGEELSEREFAVLGKTTNLDHVITNKMSKLRKDEDITFTTPEILYAIEKTKYKKYFYNHFKDSLEEDPYQSIDYDFAKILKALDLIDYTYGILKNRVRDAGVDSLNSIEKSIYDIGSRNDK
jgi:hypothetical protein